MWSVALCRFIRRYKIAVRVDDILPVSLACLGIFPHLIQVIIGVLWAYPLKFADKIYVLGRDMQEILVKKYRIDHNTVELMPIWADTDDVVPTPIKQPIESGCLRVIIAGTIGRMQNPDLIIDAAKILSDRKSPVKFVFYGTGVLLDHLKAKTNQLSLNNVDIFENVPRSKQTWMYEQGDIVLITLRPGSYGVGVPSRFYNSIAAGKPVVVCVDPESELWLSVKENELGWVVESSVEQLASLLESITMSTNMLTISEHAREIATTQFAKSRILTKYYNSICQI